MAPGIRSASRAEAAARAGPAYTRTAIALHWLLALALLGSLGLGWMMTGLPLSPLRLKLYNWHKWAGICILALSGLRLAWRWRHPAPPLLRMPGWQRVAARAVHAGLYALFFAVPLAGWAYSSAAGFPVVVFGILPLPDWVPADRALGELVKPLHRALAYTLALLAALHVAAALEHHFVARDGLLHRMWPRRHRARNPDLDPGQRNS
jgi:cytochrome b561